MQAQFGPGESSDAIRPPPAKRRGRPPKVGAGKELDSYHTSCLTLCFLLQAYRMSLLDEQKVKARQQEALLCGHTAWGLSLFCLKS